MLECHQMVDEKNAFALEQFPDSFAPFSLDLSDLWRTWFTLTLLVLTSDNLTPVSVLSPYNYFMTELVDSNVKQHESTVYFDADIVRKMFYTVSRKKCYFIFDYNSCIP